jgi:hypothetical protein
MEVDDHEWNALLAELARLRQAIIEMDARLRQVRMLASAGEVLLEPPHRGGELEGARARMILIRSTAVFASGAEDGDEQ